MFPVSEKSSFMQRPIFKYQWEPVLVLIARLLSFSDSLFSQWKTKTVTLDDFDFKQLTTVINMAS